MALISCPECGHRVSDKAERCPECAHPISDATPKKIEIESGWLGQPGTFAHTANVLALMILIALFVIFVVLPQIKV